MNITHSNTHHFVYIELITKKETINTARFVAGLTNESCGVIRDEAIIKIE